MKPSLSLLPLTAALLLANGFAVSSLASSPPPIPKNQLGAVAGKQYQGDGLSVRATVTGAELRCAFQRLEGEVTAAGLWLRSTADNSSGERFRVRAVAVGREFGDQHADWFGVPPSGGPGRVNAELRTMGLGNLFPFAEAVSLPGAGLVNVTDQVAQFLRPGVTEEYSVSVDGVRQDFLIAQPPVGTGELRLELDVAGATVTPLGNGVRLSLPGSGRQLAYHRLHVTDATGRELPARMEVASGILPDVEGAHPAARIEAAKHPSANLLVTSESAGLEAPALRQAEMPAATKLAVLVDDANAVYPVRIDPTFSDADWISLGGFLGANGIVYAVVVDDQGQLFVGGAFSMIGELPVNNVAKWDGTEWSVLGLGIEGGVSGGGARVYALAVADDNLYVGGGFSLAGGETANRVAKWNGHMWTALGSGMNNDVLSLAVAGTNLYAGGRFTTASDGSANRVAKWNGSNWSALGLGIEGESGGLAPLVYTLAVSGTNLYAGGNFTTAGGAPAANVAKWDGNEWSALGAGTDRQVRALVVSDTNLFAGGFFQTAGVVAANRVAKWDGNEWTALGPGVVDVVYALAVVETNLYAAARFTLAKWDGSSWAALGDMPPGSGFALAVSGDHLFVGGNFPGAGGTAAQNIAKWNGNAWEALETATGAGLNNTVNAVAVADGILYAGGTFTKAGSVVVNRVAKWDGNGWSALGAGVDNTVFALAVSETNLYAGGWFTTAGGSAANRIARWDGNSWLALGAGIGLASPDAVRALAVSGSNLYAAGNFTTAGGVSANRIAKWDGNLWAPLGAGVDGTIRALAVVDNDLYVGGGFTMAGETNANRVAKWDGNAWSPLGSGVDNLVVALAVSGNNLYAGGQFISAGGNTANRVAKWNGSSWAALGDGLGPGVSSSVLALAVSGTDVYAGGAFTIAGGSTANRIAKWDGSAWMTLGSGLNNTVNTLAISGTNLVVGGLFTTAGDTGSLRAARANIAAARGRFGDLNYAPATGFSGTFVDASVGQPYRIQTSPSLAGPWTDFTNFVYAGPVVISDPAPLVGTNKFFRAVTP